MNEGEMRSLDAAVEHAQSGKWPGTMMGCSTVLAIDTELAALRAEVKLYKERCELEQTRYEGISSANEELRASNASLSRDLAEARGQLCRAKEAIGKSMPNVSYGMKPKSDVVWSGNWIVSASLMKEIDAAVSSPCTHAERVKELEKGFREQFLSYRNIEEPCEKCGGTGVRTYPSTATWSGGCGGQTLTSDVCDICWGSGDTYRKGANLRDMKSRLAALEKEAEEAKRLRDELHEIDMALGNRSAFDNCKSRVEKITLAINTAREATELRRRATGG